jgi:hypothetical protein
MAAATMLSAARLTASARARRAGRGLWITLWASDGLEAMLNGQSELQGSLQLEFT